MTFAEKQRFRLTVCLNEPILPRCGVEGHAPSRSCNTDMDWVAAMLPRRFVAEFFKGGWTGSFSNYAMAGISTRGTAARKTCAGERRYYASAAGRRGLRPNEARLPHLPCEGSSANLMALMALAGTLEVETAVAGFGAV